MGFGVGAWAVSFSVRMDSTKLIFVAVHLGYSFDPLLIFDYI